MSRGRKPNASDRGYRYEVRGASGYPEDEQTMMGWSNDLKGAEKLAAAMRLAPGCSSTEIFDLRENKPVIKRYAGILR
jgi:hypothetical protein